MVCVCLCVCVKIKCLPVDGSERCCLYFLHAMLSEGRLQGRASERHTQGECETQVCVPTRDVWKMRRKRGCSIGWQGIDAGWSWQRCPGFRRRHVGTWEMEMQELLVTSIQVLPVWFTTLCPPQLRDLYLESISEVNVGEMSLMTTKSKLAQREPLGWGNRDVENEK